MLVTINSDLWYAINSKIATLGVSKSCVSYTHKKNILKGEINAANKTGRSRKFSERRLRYIVRGVNDDPFISPRSIKSQYLPNQDVSTRTIQRVLVDQNFKSFRSVKKPILKSFHKIARLNFCKQFVTKPEGFWNNWIFSDETRICCNGSDRPPLVRRKPGSSCLNEKFIRPTTKFPLSIMVWGCISRKGLGSLFIIEGSVTSEVYIKIIDQSLLPTIHKYYNGEEIGETFNGLPDKIIPAVYLESIISSKPNICSIQEHYYE